MFAICLVEDKVHMHSMSLYKVISLIYWSQLQCRQLCMSCFNHIVILFWSVYLLFLFYFANQPRVAVVWFDYSYNISKDQLRDHCKHLVFTMHCTPQIVSWDSPLQDMSWARHKPGTQWSGTSLDLTGVYIKSCGRDIHVILSLQHVG